MADGSGDEGRGAGRRDQTTRPSKADSTTTEGGSGGTRTPARSFLHRGVSTRLCLLRPRCRRCRRSAPLDTLRGAYRAPRWRGGTRGSMARVPPAGIPPSSSAAAPAPPSRPGCGDGAGGASRPGQWPTRAAAGPDRAPRASCLNPPGCVGGWGAPPWCGDAGWKPPALAARWPQATQVGVPTAGWGRSSNVPRRPLHVVEATARR